MRQLTREGREEAEPVAAAPIEQAQVQRSDQRGNTMSQMPHDDPEFPMLEGPFESPRPNQTSADDAPCAERMTRAELADLLERVAPLVRSGDSAEGRIQYLLPDEGPWDDVMVSVAVRSGNLGGTGFWHVITGGQDMDSLLAELDRKGRP